LVREHRIQRLDFPRPAVEQQGLVLARDGCADRAGVGSERKPAHGAGHRHLLNCGVELAARGAQLIEGFLNVATVAEAFTHGFERGADQGRMTLLFAQQLQRGRTVGHFAGEFESRHQHDGEKAEAQNDHQHQQGDRRRERAQNLE
jgi:hypothetical protein